MIKNVRHHKTISDFVVANLFADKSVDRNGCLAFKHLEETAVLVA
jgi:hypothetical protein